MNLLTVNEMRNSEMKELKEYEHSLFMLWQEAKTIYEFLQVMEKDKLKEVNE